MADKKDLDPNPPAEDRTIRALKRSMDELSLNGLDRAHEFESEPEFKKQKLEQLQRKAYYSVLLASKAETSAISHKKSQIIEKLMNEWKIDHKTYISVSDKSEKDLLPSYENGMHIAEVKPLAQEKNVTWRPSSAPKCGSSWGSINPESLVGKRVRAKSPDEDHLPTNKKMKLDELHKQAYDDVLHAFNAESPALSSSRTLIMQDLLDECNKAQMASVDDKIKTDPPLVEAITTAKIVEPRSRIFPYEVSFRPTDDEMANFYLKKKALGKPLKTVCIPDECHDIFSTHPHDLPGYPKEKHQYFYCRKPNGQDPRNLWTQIGEATTVFDLQDNGVGIKRRFTLTEQEEESNDIFLPDEEETPIEEWFMDEISLPSSVAETDLVLCHVICKKKKNKKKEEEEVEEIVDDFV